MNMRRFTAAVLIAAMCLCLCSCGTVKTYIVRFDGDGGRLVSGQKMQTVEEGGSAVAPEFEKDGMILTGWSSPLTDINSDTTITALWSTVYTVEFDAMGGTLVGGSLSQELVGGSTPEAPELSREGYNFAGWDSELSPVSVDTVYRAMWEGKVLSAHDVYKRISPSTVEILTYDAKGNCIGIGSGFFIDSEGTVLTNHHVIEGGSAATVTTYGGDESQAVLVSGYDAGIDLAVLQTEFTDTVPVVFAQKSPEHGDTIYALGSALGETDTFTTGIISNPCRIKDGVEYIQIDAALSPGNSGGPLINDRGEVLGVNCWQYIDGQNMNFAIAIAELENIDRSSPVSMSEFGASAHSVRSTSTGSAVESDDHQTIVRNDDEGEEVYELADTIEWECNDSAAIANPIEKGVSIAGYVDINDIDFYSFTVSQGEEIRALAITYWGEDDEYFVVALVDEDINFVKDTSGNGCFFEFDSESESWELDARLNAGTYYIAVLLMDDYPYEVGCYYLAGLTKD